MLNWIIIYNVNIVQLKLGLFTKGLYLTTVLRTNYWLRNITIYSLEPGRDEWVFETVSVKLWWIESFFASKAIWALLTWGE